ncbi:MAG: hypothetical protein II956_11235 [Bacteroidales bacterium]|nr:hypothetical protein [Bacteroidales bacterium]
MKRLVYILPLLIFLSCENETVYSDYADAPVKSVEVSPMFFPVACSDGTIITITSEHDTLNYNFVKINSNAEITQTGFSLTWKESSTHRTDPNNRDNKDGISKQSPSEVQVKIDVSSGTIRKNANDEFYFEFYSSNNFGRSYYAVVKFDKDGNKLFQLDSIVSIMNMGSMGGGNNSVSKIPVKGTPLDNGGYAMIFQVPNQGMMQQNTAYDLTLRYINAAGKTEHETDLEFDETISIENICSINNNIFVYYTNADEAYFLKIFSLDGSLIYSSAIDYYPYIFAPDSKYAYISAVDASGTCALVLNDDGDEYIRVPTTDAFFSNAMKIDDEIYFSGIEISGASSINTMSALLKTVSSMTGVLSTVSLDGTIQKYIRLDYDDGIACYACFKDGSGGYNVFMSRISSESAVNLNMNNTGLGNRIYVYNVSSLEKLQIN